MQTVVGYMHFILIWRDAAMRTDKHSAQISDDTFAEYK